MTHYSIDNIANTMFETAVSAPALAEMISASSGIQSASSDFSHLLDELPVSPEQKEKIAAAQAAVNETYMLVGIDYGMGLIRRINEASIEDYACE